MDDTKYDQVINEDKMRSYAELVSVICSWYPSVDLPPAGLNSDEEGGSGTDKSQARARPRPRSLRSSSTCFSSLNRAHRNNYDKSSRRPRVWCGACPNGARSFTAHFAWSPRRMCMRLHLHTNFATVVSTYASKKKSFVSFLF